MKLFLYALMATFPLFGACDEATLKQVLAHVAQDQQGVFNYQETRQLELATSPIETQGMMLTDSDGSLVKLQLKPERVIMAISGDALYYWNPAQNQRHQMPVSAGEDATQQILIFRQLLQGRLDELQQQFQLDAESDDQGWTLRLQPKQADESLIAAITVSGNSSGRHMIIRQSDGDSSEYRITPSAPQTAQHYRISTLLQEAAGE